VNKANARYLAQQAEALAGSLERVLQSLERAIEGAPPAPTELARLAHSDAQDLARRVHALRRRVEEIAVADTALPVRVRRHA
jgi:hypothetical protein